MRDMKTYRDTGKPVPQECGRARGRAIVFKAVNAGLWLRPKGLRESSEETVLVPWETLYQFALHVRHNDKVQGLGPRKMRKKTQRKQKSDREKLLAKELGKLGAMLRKQVKKVDAVLKDKK